jgi:type I restriction enzyme M protein
VISVTALDEHAARSLVMKPVEGRLVFAPAAVDRILLLTDRQPFLVQSLCHRIFERCAASGDRNVTTVTVDASADQLVDDNEHFRTLWDYIKSDCRRFIICLIDRLSAGPNKVTLGLIAAKLEEEGISYPDELALVKDIDELRELEIIELKHDGADPVYAIAVPLFSMWVRGAIDSNVYRLGALQEEAQ